MQDLKVSIIQDELDWQDAGANRDRFARHIQSLATSDLIVLPETFNCGFCMEPAGVHESMDGETVAWMRRESAHAGSVITGSLVIREGEHYKNRMIWAMPDGAMAFYDKRHLFRFGDEHIRYTAGEKRVVVDLLGWRIALFVCYDLRFPVWSRNRSDYDVALYVANWPNARQYAWDTLLRSRAIENQAYVVGVNRIGVDGTGNEFSGGSVVVDCLGRPMVDCGDKRMNATVTLSRSDQERFRETFPASLDADEFSLAQA